MVSVRVAKKEENPERLEKARETKGAAVTRMCAHKINQYQHLSRTKRHSHPN
jgi:hypothetical protein